MFSAFCYRSSLHCAALTGENVKEIPVRNAKRSIDYLPPLESKNFIIENCLWFHLTARLLDRYGCEIPEAAMINVCHPFHALVVVGHANVDKYAPWEIFGSFVL